ncbi:hypothetical protein V1224_14115 [Lachnospiraceae bacterium JLR.KK008]
MLSYVAGLAGGTRPSSHFAGFGWKQAVDYRRCICYNVPTGFRKYRGVKDEVEEI